MTTSNPGYGAIPPITGSNGQILTSSGMNGSNWSSTVTPNAIQIGNPDPVITFKSDGVIVTKAGTITANDWISVINVMKQLVMDMSQDEELVSKYPYIRDAAHIWMMNKLKGE